VRKHRRQLSRGRRSSRCRISSRRVRRPHRRRPHRRRPDPRKSRRHSLRLRSPRRPRRVKASTKARRHRALSSRRRGPRSFSLLGRRLNPPRLLPRRRRALSPLWHRRTLRRSRLRLRSSSQSRRPHRSAVRCRPTLLAHTPTRLVHTSASSPRHRLHGQARVRLLPRRPRRLRSPQHVPPRHRPHRRHPQRHHPRRYRLRRHRLRRSHRSHSHLRPSLTAPAAGTWPRPRRIRGRPVLLLQPTERRREPPPRHLPSRRRQLRRRRRRHPRNPTSRSRFSRRNCKRRAPQRPCRQRQWLPRPSTCRHPLSSSRACPTPQRRPLRIRLPVRRAARHGPHRLRTLKDPTPRIRARVPRSRNHRSRCNRRLRKARRRSPCIKAA